jgi:hypothetical protein
MDARQAVVFCMVSCKHGGLPFCISFLALPAAGMLFICIGRAGAATAGERIAALQNHKA